MNGFTPWLCGLGAVKKIQHLGDDRFGRVLVNLCEAQTDDPTPRLFQSATLPGRSVVGAVIGSSNCTAMPPFASVVRMNSSCFSPDMVLQIVVCDRRGAVRGTVRGRVVAVLSAKGDRGAVIIQPLKLGCHLWSLVYSNGSLRSKSCGCSAWPNGTVCLVFW
jgi:hypothetical protein